MDQTNGFINLIQFSLNITLPIFLVVMLGTALKYGKLINQEFIKVSSNLVFKVGLPIMLFSSTSTYDFSRLVNIPHILLLLFTTLIIFSLTSASAHWHVNRKEDKGVFVQGAFRGNLIIIGLAFCNKAYGEEGIALAALPMAVIIIIYNILSVYTLNASLLEQKNKGIKTITDIFKNPLIIAIFAGLICNAIGLQLPKMIIQTNGYLAQMTLPIALLCIGGVLDFSQLHHDIRPAITASIWKLLLTPCVLVLLALIWPIEPIALGVLFFLTASPTATASFIMVKSMQGNSDLAAKIIILSTLLSIITVTLGLTWLISAGLVSR